MRKRIMFWTWDHGPNWFYDAVAKVCCRIWGHDPMPDNCGMPQHDHCAWCLKPMPGAVPRG